MRRPRSGSVHVHTRSPPHPCPFARHASRQVKLPPYLKDEVGEALAENIHEIWSKEKILAGWCYGPTRDDKAKRHPMLIPYAELSASEKSYDLDMALETLKVLKASGLRWAAPSYICVCERESERDD